MDERASDCEKKSQQTNDEFKKLIKEFGNEYWLPFYTTPFDAIAKIIDKTATEDTPLRQPLTAFASNLGAAKDLLEFPYLLLAPLLVDIKSIPNQVRETLNAAPVNGELTDEHVDSAKHLINTVLRGSKNHLLKRPDILNRLMHQACVLAWGSFETFCKEVFIASLNKRPDLFGVISKSQKVRDRFPVSQASWPGILERAGYDLTGKLGTIIASDRDFSSPQLLKDLFPILFADFGANEAFLKEFESPELWILGNRRHLIVHRCGIVDAEYMRKCDDNSQKLGQVLTLKGTDMEKMFSTVARCAVYLYAVARRCWLTPNP